MFAGIGHNTEANTNCDITIEECLAMCLDASWECRSIDTHAGDCKCHLSDAAPGVGATEDDISDGDWTMYVRQCAP